MQKNGRERIYERAPSGSNTTREIIERLEEMEGYWNEVLKAFKRYVEEKK
jgi:hypothetical protein